MSSKKPDIPFHMEMVFTYGVPREIWPGVRRIVAPNKGPLTQNGTNTYIVGKGAVAVIDPGPDEPTHLEAIIKATKGEQISHIFLTHTHKDHSSLVAKLAELSGAEICAHAPLHENRGARHESDAPLKTEFVDFTILPSKPLSEGEVIDGNGWRIKAVHTPGHAPDHMCYQLLGEPILFSGDHVMAWNTSVIIPPEGGMADYLASLKKLTGNGFERFLPGHGGQARAPERLVKAYLMHRRWRETSILDFIKSGKTTIPELLPLMYPNAAPAVLPAASLSILAHLEHLCQQGLVESSSIPALNSTFKPL